MKSIRLTARKQKGASLMVAVFIIIVMSVLIAVLNQMLVRSSQGVIYEVYGLRAYNAAQTGLQEMAYQLFDAEPHQCSGTATAQAELTGDLSGIAGLEFCSYKVTCSPFKVDATWHFRVTSVGKCDADSIVTERTLRIEAKSEN